MSLAQSSQIKQTKQIKIPTYDRSEFREQASQAPSYAYTTAYDFPRILVVKDEEEEEDEDPKSCFKLAKIRICIS